MARISKKERAELVSLGRTCARAACTNENDVETADDVIQLPEEWAIHFYPYKDTAMAGCPRFAIFKGAFVEWVRDTYDVDKVLES